MPNCVTYVPGIKWYLCVGKLNPIQSDTVLNLLFFLNFSV